MVKALKIFYLNKNFFVYKYPIDYFKNVELTIQNQLHEDIWKIKCTHCDDSYCTFEGEGDVDWRLSVYRNEKSNLIVGEKKYILSLSKNCHYISGRYRGGGLTNDSFLDVIYEQEIIAMIRVLQDECFYNIFGKNIKVKDNSIFDRMKYMKGLNFCSPFSRIIKYDNCTNQTEVNLFISLIIFKELFFPEVSIP